MKNKISQAVWWVVDRGVLVAGYAYLAVFVMLLTSYVELGAI